MSETSHAGTHVVPPHVQLIQMASAYWVSRAVYAAADLGLADHLATGSKSAAELAGPTGTHTASLHRLMRTLASLGVLTENATQRFALTPLGEALKSGAPGSARASVQMIAGDVLWRGFEHFLYAVRTGKPGMEKALGMSLFDYLAQHPEDATLFSETMVGFHSEEPPAVAAAYDFSRFKVIVDVGGATGNMLTTILARHPQPDGVLFDLPHVVSQAPGLIESHGLRDRIRIEAGTFFERVPAGGDAYLLSHIIHDWSEEQCLTILSNCREVMQTDSRLLIVEMVLPAGDAPHPGKMLDMVMLAAMGGQERTEPQYGALLAKAGFHLTQVVPTASAVSIVEARPA